MTASKVRPAVCLTDPIGPHRHVVVAFVSSQRPVDMTTTDVVLDPQRTDFGATGLRVASVLRPPANEPPRAAGIVRDRFRRQISRPAPPLGPAQ
jgi:hypothetical protein